MCGVLFREKVTKSTAKISRWYSLLYSHGHFVIQGKVQLTYFTTKQYETINVYEEFKYSRVADRVGNFLILDNIGMGPNFGLSKTSGKFAIDFNRSRI